MGSIGNSFNNRRGQSLVQVLVTVAIMGIVMMVVVGMQSNMSRENQALAEKLAALDFQRTLTANMSDGSLCTYHVTHPAAAFDSSLVTAQTTPPPISFGTTLLSGASATAPALATVGKTVSPLSTSVVVKSIELAEIRCTSPCANPATSGTFTALIRVNWDQTKLVRPIQPAIAQVTLHTNAAGATKTVTSCDGSSPGGASPGAGSLCGMGWSDSAAGMNQTVVTCKGFSMAFDTSAFGGPQPCPPGYTRREMQMGPTTVYFITCVQN